MRYSRNCYRVKDGRNPGHSKSVIPVKAGIQCRLPCIPAFALMMALSACATPTRQASVSVAAAGQLSATSSVRVNVINFTTQPAPFLFRFGGIQMLDTIAPPGSLGVPVLSRSLLVAPGLYRFQLFDRRTQKIAQDSLESGGKGADFSTIELIFDNDVWSITTCHCSRIYGRGGGATRN